MFGYGIGEYPYGGYYYGCDCGYGYSGISWIWILIIIFIIFFIFCNGRTSNFHLDHLERC